MVLKLAKCSECGQGVPSDARTLGLCPRCLLRSALVAGSGSAAGRAGLREFNPPEPDDLRDSLEGLDVIELIGRGGMGFVYKARQRSLDRLVAVKLFPRDAYDDPSFAERFAHEARILANLSHPNIVAAYEFGESDNYCHLVMELIGGESLRQRVEGGALQQEEALDIAGQVCDALEYAHGRGVIHRDIKPENILLEKRGDGRVRVRVADFGLARLVQRGQRDFFMTAPNRLMGTPDYMSPEQRQRPGEVDARADVYALGVVMYEMLAGQLPLGKFAPPSKSAALNRVVMRCLEPVPAHRYASVSDVRKELASLGRRRPGKLLIGGGIGTVTLAVALAIWMGQKPARNDLRSAASSRPINIRVEPAHPDNHWQPLPPNDAPKVGMLITGPVFAPGPQVPPPYTYGPRFGPYPGSSAGDYLQRMEREHGANRIVHIYIDDLPDDQKEDIIHRLKALTGATSTFTSGNNKSVSVHLAPVRDIDALARQIDFGKVTSINPKTRVIEVLANSKTR